MFESRPDLFFFSVYLKLTFFFDRETLNCRTFVCLTIFVGFVIISDNQADNFPVLSAFSSNTHVFLIYSCNLKIDLMLYLFLVFLCFFAFKLFFGLSGCSLCCIGLVSSFYVASKATK